ncbi:MAG: cupin domain-containing protein [Myxococcota bacterium]
MLSRSHVAHDHAVITPGVHQKRPLPGWTKSSAVALIGPPMGSEFAEYLVSMEPEGEGGAPQDDVERTLFVTGGAIEVAWGEETRIVEAGGYIYLPAGLEHAITARDQTNLLLIEKPYLDGPEGDEPAVVVGVEGGVEAEAFGDGGTIRSLLPLDPAFDLNLSLCELEPGASPQQMESRLSEKGITFLDGRVIARVGTEWYPLSTGDTLWIAPFIPHWFCAIGRRPARFLVFTDENRDPLAGEE